MIDKARWVNLDQASQLSITGKLSKQENKDGDLYSFQLTISGSLVFFCDLCIAPASVDLDFSIEEMIKKPADTNLLDEHVEVVWLTNTKLDIAPLLATHLYLQIPMQVLCSDDCAGLCESCGVNLNQGSCDCAEKEIATDPRFDMLKTIKFK